MASWNTRGVSVGKVDLPATPKPVTTPPSWQALQPTARAPKRPVVAAPPSPQPVAMQPPSVVPPSSVAGGAPPSLSALTPQQPRMQYDAKAIKDAQGAAFASAKDEAGLIAQSAMRGMSGALRSRGMGGAGYEAGQIGDVVTRGADQIGEASRANMLQTGELAQREAELNYTGGITQRGQDIGRDTSRDSLLMNADLTTRGQDLNANQAMNALLAGMAQSEFSGGIAQRGQDIGVNEGRHALEVQQAQAEQDREQQLINGDTSQRRSLEAVIMDAMLGDINSGTPDAIDPKLEKLRQYGFMPPVLG